MSLPLSRASPLSFSHSPFSSSRIDLLLYLPSILFSRSKRSRASVKCVRKSRSCLFRILREIVIEKFNVLALLTNICVQLYTSVCPPPSLPRKPFGATRGSFYYTHPRFLFIFYFTYNFAAAFRSDSDRIVPAIYLNRERARVKEGRRRELVFLPPSLDWIYCNFFFLPFTTTRDSRPRVPVSLRGPNGVYQTKGRRIVVERGRLSYYHDFRHTAPAPNNNAFPPVRCPNKRHRLSSLRAARQDISYMYIYKKEYQKNKYICVYIDVCVRIISFCPFPR